jgi:hypothetical protein
MQASMGTPSGPNVYDNVIDIGNHCHFADGRFRVMALFKSDRAVGFHFSKPRTLWESLRNPFAYTYLPLSEAEVSAVLHSAVPHYEWVAGASDEIVRRWHTSDRSAAACYFARGHRNLYSLVIQTAAMDEVFRRVEQ